MANAQNIIVHYGELGLKGRNQSRFRKQLRENVRFKLRGRGLEWPVQEKPGYVSVHVPDGTPAETMSQARDSLRQVFGVAWVASSLRLPHGGFTRETRAADLARAEEHMLALARRSYQAGKSFAVRVKRADKRIPIPSLEMERHLGGMIRDHTDWARVNLSAPDYTFELDLREQAMFLFSQRARGPGGLPVGTSGRVLTLLSGGIDSPVAAWCMAKRGCRVDFLHFTATHMQQEEARGYKVWQLARRVAEFTLNSRLFLVPYNHFDLALLSGGARTGHDVVLFRRFMARVGEKLARRIKAEALVSGDNLSQVASQTLSNLVATSQAASMPILRPLLGFDKEEIIQRAQDIGTYELSLEPYKDCCAIISRHPRISSRHESLTVLERTVFPDYEGLIGRTLSEIVCLQVRVDQASAGRETQGTGEG